MPSAAEMVQALNGGSPPWWGSENANVQPQLLQALSGAQTTYPTAQDAAKYGDDVAYGTPLAAYLEPGSGMPQQSTKLQSVLDFVNSNTKDPLPAKREAMTPDTREQLQQAYMATMHSPVAYMGFNPRMTATTDTRKNSTTSGLSGLYHHPSTIRWWDQADPSALVHESTHAGLDVLRSSGELGKILGQYGLNDNPRVDEYLVRALMRKNFGDVEVIGAANKLGPMYNYKNDSQIQAGRDYNKDRMPLLKALEGAAQKHNEARQLKRGPA